MNNQFRDDVIDLLKSSTLVQATITLIVIVTLMVMILEGREPPQVLLYLTLLVVGFYFGAKSTAVSNTTLDKVNRIMSDNKP